MGTRFDSVLAILVDGARPDVMRRLADAGEMPAFRRHLIDRGGFREILGVFPTVSGPAHLPILTGLHPGEADLPGIRWAERPTDRRGFLGRTRSYMAPFFRAWKLERDVSPRIQTLFHHIEGLANVNTWFLRGCESPDHGTRLAKMGAFARSLTSRDWYRSDEQAEAGVLRAIERGQPSVSALFPAVDELGHRFGPLCEESYEAYRRFDAALGRILDALVRRRRLERTLVLVTSDHGQTGTHTHIDLPRLVARTHKKTLAYPLLWRHLLDAEAAVMVSGNAMANVYVRGRGGWHERPDFDAPGSQAGELVGSLLEEPGIEHVIYRRDARTFVVAGQGGRLIGRLEGERLLDVSVEGGDPLGYGEAVRGRLTRDEVAARTAASDYPDAPWQLVEFFRARRAGDLVVCARRGWDLRARFEYQPHNGSHGGLHRDHILVPLGVNARFESPAPIHAVDLFPTILTALDRPLPGVGSGRPLALGAA